MARTGRPTTYTEARAQEICEAIAGGRTLVSVCKAKGMPAIRTVLGWLGRYPEFEQAYARAKERRLEVLAEELLHLSDTCRKGQRVKKSEKGHIWICPKCDRLAKWQGAAWQHVEDASPLCAGVEKPRKEVVYETETVTADMIDRAKLQVDTRKWLLSKLAARTYGDRLQVAGDADAPLAIVVKRLDRKQEEGGQS